jgi:UDP-N-acetylmuramoyl-tripeptide--D-alanyl-D-alanine ligase
MAEKLWTAEDIAAVTGGRLVGSNFDVTGISIDTRTAAQGDLFIALKGPRFDGHDFIDVALDKKVAGIMATRETTGNTIVVNDTLRAMEDMGAGARARSGAKIFAITGSVGKTSTKEMLARCLSVLGKTHAAEASLNNHWGVPLSLVRLPASAQYGVFELGMNAANEITPLSRLVSPHISLITTIAAAHVEKLGSLENIARAKAEIFHGMDANGVAILPRDVPEFPILLAEARTQGIGTILTFGATEGSDLHMISVQPNEDASDMRFSFKGREYKLKLGLAGAHQAMNALAVLAAIAQITNDIEKVFPALENMQAVLGRGNRWSCIIKKGAQPVLVIDETHNASPAAVKAALEVLAQIPTTGRRLVALGDMLELGDTGPAEHAGLKSALLSAQVDQVFTCGKLVAHLAEVLPFGRNKHFTDSEALAAQIGELVQPGDILLIKGSRGAKMKLVIDALQGLGQSAQKTPMPATTGR